MSGEPVLCYIDWPFAYFTTRPLEKQTGDDWNDAPYEHNAGRPYEWHERLDADIPKWEIIKVAFTTDLETPSCVSQPNSPWSVDDINAGRTAWLLDPKYGHRPDSERYTREVEAGVTLDEFTRIIQSRGGTVYVAAEPRS